MTRFIQAEFPAQHAGVVRIERAAQALNDSARNFDGARGTASLLLAAFVSALLVVANQLVDTWTDGHLLAAWVMLWAVAFAALAVFASPARRVGQAVREGLRGWAAARRQAVEDERLWQIALTDARVMADLSRAMSQDADRAARRYA